MPASIHQLPSRPVPPFAPDARPPTLGEVFAPAEDTAGTGFALAQIGGRAGALLWVQDRAALARAGRPYPPGLARWGTIDLVHVVAGDARGALWAMEEGLRCPALAAVVGEIWGDPPALSFTATRRLAVAVERSGVPAWLVRLAATPNLSGARTRWRVRSRRSLPPPFDNRAPGEPAWALELFRARDRPPGAWEVAHEGGAPDRLRLVPALADGALAPSPRGLRAG